MSYRKRNGRKLALIAFCAAFAIVASACGNAWGGTGATSAESAGVLPNEIRVGGVASITSPVGDNFKFIFDGVNAYFEMVNEEGGVHGRTINLVAEYDDGTQASKNLASVRTLVEEDEVFAVIPVASPIFTGGQYLADRRIPTFGLVINTEWSLSEALFGGGNDGDVCLDCAETFTYLPFIAKLMGVSRVGVISYSVVQSKQCSDGQKAALEKFGFEVPFVEQSLTFGFTDLSAQIARIKESGIELIATCMDGEGSARLSKAIREAGLDIKQYWPIGYDQTLLDQFPEEMEGIYVQTTAVPFELADASPGLQTYLEWMDKTGGQVGETSLTGWLNADLFVKGLEEAGPDPTREKLIDAIYSLEDYDAGEIVLPVDFPELREDDEADANEPEPACLGFIQVQDGAFEPVFINEEEPWACVDVSKDTLPDEPLRPEDFGL